MSGVGAYWADVRAQLQLETRLPGFWQVYRLREPRCPRGVEVPAGWYYAVFWRWGEPPIKAETLTELERLVLDRMCAMPVELHLPRGVR